MNRQNAGPIKLTTLQNGDWVIIAYENYFSIFNLRSFQSSSLFGKRIYVDFYLELKEHWERNEMSDFIELCEKYVKE